jgi:AcrR family transcriptional regulator
MPEPAAAEKTFLFIAHPGHELCVHGWLEAARPRVFVLTDGSGRSGRSRIDSTSKVLRRAGAEPGSVYGRFTDQEVYRAILERDYDPLLETVAEFAGALVREGAGAVAGDAAEGFNPAYDVCRMMINAAAEMARRLGGRRIVNRDFLLVGRHDTCPPELRAGATWLRLDDDALERKLEAARSFPELKDEIDAALAGELLALRQHPELAAGSPFKSNAPGGESYRVECLRPADGRLVSGEFDGRPPFYESHGERRVAAGHYRRAIRYREHILPLASALRDYVGKCRPLASPAAPARS